MVEDGRYTGASIEIVEGLEAVRLRPSLYLGDLKSPETPVRLLCQALCHAADASLDDECSSIDIKVDGPAVHVDYDAGMPLEVHPRLGHVVAALFLTLHAGCRNLKKHINVGDELCDLGLSVLNALSDELRVATAHGGQTALYVFRKGRATNAPQIVPTSRADFTEVSFRLDSTILGGNVLFEPAALCEAVDRVRALLPRVRINLSGEHGRSGVANAAVQQDDEV